MNTLRCILTVAIGSLVSLGAVATTTATPPEVAAVTSTLAALRMGGYTIVVLHGRTDAEHEDSPDAVGGDCAHQRGLSDLGRLNASGTGKVLRRAGVPVSAVISGAFCRTAETAERLDLAEVVLDPGLDVHARPEDLRMRSAQPRAPGANIVLVTHPSNAMQSWPLLAHANEADVLVLCPDGHGSAELVARMSIEDLSRYARSERAPTLTSGR